VMATQANHTTKSNQRIFHKWYITFDAQFIPF